MALHRLQKVEFMSGLKKDSRYAIAQCDYLLVHSFV